MAQNKKNRDVGKSSIKNRKEIKHGLSIAYYSNHVFGILLLTIFVLSLYLRTVMPYASVFRDGVVAFASDDAIFHMRLVENTLHNFPHRIFYDAFTQYPTATTIHWGPLQDQLIATLSLIAGMGSYSMQTVNTIGAFFPAICGALVVFPVYFIGKHIYNRSAGLLAAFMIAILPGGFFSRSTLGFTTHHAAEVIFSTATLFLFILAIKTGRQKNIKFSDMHLREKAVIYSILAGLMLATYQNIWPGAPFFGMIISIFILIQYIIDDMQGKSTDYLAIATIPMFLIDLIMVIPYVNPAFGFATDNYSWFHIAVPLGGMGLPIMLSLISREIKRRGYKPYYYPLSLGGFFLLSMLIMMIVLPQMYSSIISAPNIVFEVHTGGASTIAEVQSTFAQGGQVWGNFPVTGFLQSDTCVILFIFVALAYLGYRVARRQKPEETLLLVWNIVMFLAIYGQIRWTYYFAVNVALMVGYMGSALSERILKFGGWEWSIDKIHLKNISLTPILSSVLVAALVIFFVYPSLVVTAIGTHGQPPLSTYGGGEPSGGGFSEWLETLNWMRNNTPDPGLDYYAIFQEPKNQSSPYPYPQTAYGVMSWWDYGHIITYWAHRIPNANPFQGGIGGGSQHLPGPATFLTAKSEEEANKVLYDLGALGINGKPGARYVVSNAYMAYQIMGVFGVWNEEYDYYTQVQTRDGMQTVPSLKYYENMEAKLHIFDGNNLKRYRLVHESARNPYGDETSYKNIYNVLYKGNIPVENSGLVKVFEFVKGAKVTGRAPPNTTVTITNTIKTNIGRTIEYSQTTSSNGTYEFTVPYSTLGPMPGETQFDTKPTGPYNVVSGNVSKTIDVVEKDNLDGNILILNLV
jgi:oligosaccharyl transferase (archaeosortase A-associated)